MQLGMIGLGRMGANITRRVMRDGHTAVAFDTNPDTVKQLEEDGAVGATELEDFVAKLEKPRVAWVMVPAGITGKVVMQVAEFMEEGDIIIDGGNSNYRDDIDMAAKLKERGIHYVDIGTSGGVFGLQRGYCLMIGGEDEVVEHLDPLLRSIAPGLGDIERTPGPRGRPGPRGAGLPALRPQRCRPLRQDGPQRHRVRDDGRLRRGPQRAAARRRRRQGVRALGRDDAARAAAVLPLRPRHREGHRGVAARLGGRVLAARPDRRGAEPEPEPRRAGRAASPTPARAAGRSRRPSTRACPRRCCRRRCSPGSPAAARPCTPTSCSRPCARPSAATSSSPPASSAPAASSRAPDPSRGDICP